jgi:hypothetical protein
MNMVVFEITAIWVRISSLSLNTKREIPAYRQAGEIRNKHKGQKTNVLNKEIWNSEI